MKVGDFFQHRKRWWLRLHEKGGKRHEVPCHKVLQEYLDAWIKAAKHRPRQTNPTLPQHA
jgi:integrase